MRIRIIALPDGSWSAFIMEGDPEQAATKLRELTRRLTERGLRLSDVSAVENHRPNDLMHGLLHKMEEGERA